ncbi:Acg family FMN-binding oxidoreductase [Salinarimonas sp.]|uniref:Acg family FMN-binding oxidoreductase n=1 Tax=Salinarimonas sp. TaxID=2766526 RepID=UPI0032D97C0A
MSAAASLYEEALAAQRAPLAETPEPRELVRYATLAASGHNTQPWRFRLRADRIDVEPDLSRRTPVVDPDDHHLYASIGAVTEALVLSARARGIAAEAAYDDAGEGRVVVDLRPGATPPRDEARLFAAIPERQCTRSLYDGRPAAVNAIDRMVAAAATHGVELIYVSHPTRLEQLTELIVAGNAMQMDDSGFVGELKSWLRYAPRDAVARGDGLYGPCAGNPTLPAWLGPLVLPLVFRKSPETKKLLRQIRSSSGLLVFVASEDTRAGHVAAGRAYQRAALQATADGLKLAFVNQTVEVPAQRAKLCELLGLGDRRPNLVLRVGHAPAMPKSLRRPVEEVVLAE